CDRLMTRKERDFHPTAPRKTLFQIIRRLTMSNKSLHITKVLNVKGVGI
ncbi:unnamed protein product, partial [Allacma fusca]